MSEGIHSTGRGGAGNIGKEAEATHYMDASIVHEGVYGESQRPEYSAGRGGVGNMGKSPRLAPVDDGKGKAAVPSQQQQQPKQVAGDVIPETAMRGQLAGGYHTGRGGSGNARTGTPRTNSGGKSAVQKVEGKVKQLFGGKESG